MSEYQGFVWLGIALCISQSAIFSGLNLAMFGVSRLRLDVEVDGEHRGEASGEALPPDRRDGRAAWRHRSSASGSARRSRLRREPATGGR